MDSCPLGVHHSEVVLRVGVAAQSSKPKPLQRLVKTVLHTTSTVVQAAEIALGLGMASFSGAPEPLSGLTKILGDTAAVTVQYPKIVLGWGKPFPGRKPKPSRPVRETAPLCEAPAVHAAEVALRRSVALLGSLQDQTFRLHKVLLHATPVEVEGTELVQRRKGVSGDWFGQQSPEPPYDLFVCSVGTPTRAASFASAVIIARLHLGAIGVTWPGRRRARL